MGDAWFTGVPDELAQLLVDAHACAETCETYLAAHPDALHVLAAPVAVAQVLIDLIDHPPEIVLAAVRLCRDLATAAADALEGALEVVESLRRVALSAAALLDATA
jgi:adenylate kinase